MAARPRRPPRAGSDGLSPTLRQASAHDSERLAPYQADLKGVLVESPYNWYWLVDGVMEADYGVHLANPAAMHQYSGLK